MKYIKKLDVELTNLYDKPFLDDNKEPMIMSVESFILGRIQSDNQFGASVDTLTSASQIKKAVSECADEDYVALETKDWELLAKAVKEPAAPYNANIAHCLIPIITAVLDAKDSKD